MTQEKFTKKLLITKEDMMLHGCKNCVLLACGKCFHSIVPNKEITEYSFTYYDNASGKSSIEIGYCMEYIEFIMSFAEPGDTASQMWEKFFLVMPKMLSLKDNLEYARLTNEIEQLQIENPQSSQLHDLISQRDSLKFWISNLSFNIAKAHQKINDREIRNETKEITKIPLSQMAKLINESSRKVVEIEKKQIEKKS